MDPCTRKRTRPANITTRPAKARQPEVPALETPEDAEGDVHFDYENAGNHEYENASDFEHENIRDFDSRDFLGIVERMIREELEKNKQERSTLRTVAANNGIEILGRESDEETEADIGEWVNVGGEISQEEEDGIIIIDDSESEEIPPPPTMFRDEEIPPPPRMSGDEEIPPPPRMFRDKEIERNVRDVYRAREGAPIHLIPRPKEMHKVKEGIFPTRMIYYGSPYWEQFIKLAMQVLPNTPIHEKSIYDCMYCHVIRYNDGTIKATRNHETVVIRRKNDVPEEDMDTYYRIFKQFPNKFKVGQIPTELILWNSEYYTKLVEKLMFPTDKSYWKKQRGDDNVVVYFRLGVNGKSLFVSRCGVVMKMYP